MTHPAAGPTPFFIVPQSDPLMWHQSFVEHLAFLFRPRIYVELGLYRCAVFNRIIPHAGALVGVDIDPEAGKVMTKAPNAQFICSTTDAFAAALRKNPIPIDMLFIDADHNCSSVLKDFWNFFPFVIPHGIILLHDTHPPAPEFTKPQFCHDAYKAIASLAKHQEQFELMTLPLGPGLTLCRKRTTQLRWMEPPAK
jgi:predicted O-methyltransferase YrrM